MKNSFFEHRILCKLVLVSALLCFGVQGHVSSGTVVDLTDDNFDELTASGTWFVDIYAPWCSHCRQLEPVWVQLAEELKEKNIKVARVDGTKHKVLLSRFGVNAFPSIFLLQHGATWVYSGTRTLASLKDFALQSHQDEVPLPFWKAPNSSVGRVLGRVHRVPSQIKHVYRFLRHEKGFSDLSIVVAFLAIPVVVGAITICAVDAIHLRQARMGGDAHDHMD
mmetsp:Transcript_14105/g.30582  ORF Transcript_14105/g.30582 Transcript_14105/m.30582 type:complete len:222 (+) Transcript_14105:141-806(+)|eukprot:CAMPEP_0202897728 /NCGR_PEP_ID=MMETSP1392-20130828/6424_1 /ASSEMBLY_ACC=CAM_ASM_000868 /TAXON_ID=225041 /ORGANISM="Chlamydomonas chlamydogama, Strain SAG 11-48b" /LENGTH=221 /DNA_ID=CAMNT_0049583455 /DNA_START=141 /DNA_END=806 /DNA_ORIENTATION=-